MSDSVYHSIFVQQGSGQTYRTGDESRYLVLDEAWGGHMQRQLLSTTCLASFPGTSEGKAEAEAEAKRIRKERGYS